MTTVAPEPARVARESEARRAAGKDLLRFLPGLAPFGLVLGVTMAGMGQGTEAVLGAVLFIGGSAHLTTATALHDGSGLWVALGTGLLVNARIFLYGAVLAPRFATLPRWYRWTAPAMIVDQTFLGAIDRDPDDPAFRTYWSWFGGVTVAVWTVLMTIGVLLGPHLHELRHAGLVAVALFVAMLAPRLDTTSGVAATAGGAGALLGLLVVPTLAVPVGILTGVGAAFLAASQGSTS